jgi:hypothetical protein
MGCPSVSLDEARALGDVRRAASTAGAGRRSGRRRATSRFSPSSWRVTIPRPTYVTIGEMRPRWIPWAIASARLRAWSLRTMVAR